MTRRSTRRRRSPDHLGIEPGPVYKTLVVLHAPPGRRAMPVMLASDRELDPRALARATGAKSARMASHREAERLTGLQVGGIGALALSGRPFDTCLDRAAIDHAGILVNPGRRGLNVRIAVSHLVRRTRTTVIDASGPTGE